VIVCRTCAYLAAVREKESMLMICPICNTSAPPSKLWLELVIKE